MDTKLKIILGIAVLLVLGNIFQGWDSFKSKEAFSKAQKEITALRTTNKEITVQYRENLAKAMKSKSVKISPVIRDGKPVLGPDGQVLNIVTTVDREESSTQTITQDEHRKIVESEIAKIKEQYEAKFKEIEKKRSYRGNIFVGKSLKCPTLVDLGLTKPIIWKLDFVPLVILDTTALDSKNTSFFLNIGYRY